MLYWSSMYRLCLLLLAQTLIGSFAYIVFVNAAMFMQDLHRLGSCFGGNGIRFHNQNYWMCHCPDLRTVLQCDRCFFPPHKATKHTMNADIYFLSRNQRTISQSGQLKSLNEASKSLGLKKIWRWGLQVEQSCDLKTSKVKPGGLNRKEKDRREEENQREIIRRQISWRRNKGREGLSCVSE